MAAWAKHFEQLEISKVGHSSQLKDAVAVKFANSINNVLDVPFTVEKIQGIVKELKRGKSSGPDNIIPEYIIHGSSLFEVCHCSVLPHSFTAIKEYYSPLTIVVLY